MNPERTRWRSRRVGRGPLHKGCVASMIERLLGEASISEAEACIDCYEWAHRVYTKWREENFGE